MSSHISRHHNLKLPLAGILIDIDEQFRHICESGMDSYGENRTEKGELALTQSRQ